MNMFTYLSRKELGNTGLIWLGEMNRKSALLAFKYIRSILEDIIIYSKCILRFVVKMIKTHH